jgi:hypothetical protein
MVNVPRQFGDRSRGDMRVRKQSLVPPHTRRGVISRAGWATTAAAAVVAAAEIVVNWNALLTQVWPQDTTGTTPHVAVGVAAGANDSPARTLIGDVTQDNSRNVFLYNTAFRVAVVRATDDVTAPKRELRDDILKVLDGLIGADQPLSGEQAQALGQRLGVILDQAPVTTYRLQGREFTLPAGTAYYLPDGDDSIAVVGPAPDGTAHAIILRRNGRQSIMAVGAVREFRRGAETCRLLLHEIATDFSTATFSYACGS